MSRLIKTNFTSIPNSLFTAGVSAKSVGLYAYFASRPDDWIFYVAEVASHFKDGTDSVRSGIKELEESGYLLRSKNKAQDGTFKYDYYLFTAPLGINPYVDESTVDESNTTNTDLTTIKKEKATTGVVADVVADVPGKFTPADDAYVTAMFLDETIKSWNTTYKVKTKAEIQTWCEDFDKITRIDNITAIRQRCFIAAIHEDEGDGKGFSWRVNICSASKFRKRYNEGKLVGYEPRAKEIYEANK